MKFLYLLQAVLLVFAETSDKSQYINGPVQKVNGGTEEPKPKDGLRVAIFGDSLTEEAWGPILNKLINNNTSIKTQFQLLDYAKGGTTILQAPLRFLTNTVEKNIVKWEPYKNSTKWKSGLKSEPDIAIFMIGANDIRKDIWEFKDNTKEKWRQGYEEYVQKIQNFESKPEIYLMSTPPVLSCCEAGKHQLEAHISGDILNPMVEQIAEEYGVNFLDLFAFLGGNDPKRQQVLCEEQPSFPNCGADHYGFDRMAQFVFDNVIQKTDARMQMNKGSTQPQDMSQVISSLVERTGVQKTHERQFRQK